MEAVARFLHEEHLAECDATMTIIEDILHAVVERATTLAHEKGVPRCD